MRRSETRAIRDEHGCTVLERRWARPAAEVISLLAGDPVGASRGAIPALATATISIRTVPDQRSAEVAEQLRRWVAEVIDDRVGYTLTVSGESAQEPYRTPDRWHDSDERVSIDVLLAGAATLASFWGRLA